MTITTGDIDETPPGTPPTNPNFGVPAPNSWNLPIQLKWEAVDATVAACTLELSVCSDYMGGLMQVIPTGLNADICITIEESNDGVNWDTYSDCSTVDIVANEVKNLKTGKIYGVYYRICVDPKTNTAGTLDIVWNLKLN